MAGKARQNQQGLRLNQGFGNDVSCVCSAVERRGICSPSSGGVSGVCVRGGVELNIFRAPMRFFEGLVMMLLRFCLVFAVFAYLANISPMKCLVDPNGTGSPGDAINWSGEKN